MKYKNTNDPNEIVSFKEAVLKGLGNHKGLFVPTEIPKLPDSFFEKLPNMTDAEIAFEVLRPYIGQEDITDAQLKEIVTETFNFPLPVHPLNEREFILELFHGPTMAFKDVGARFMARCLGLFSTEADEVTVLVATSGDTGSAVAQGFHKVNGVRVIILFPKDKVSPFQEYQMTSLGDNIYAVEVDGTFDDCQALVKQALQDENLKERVNLSTANSINVARFLPQMIYYFSAVKQLHHTLKNNALLVSVPSGNFGNLTAGLYAQKMGLPIQHFIAANNANDTFYQFIYSGKYQAKPSVSTHSNAMDVGDPSNFIRIQELYNYSWEEIKKHISSEMVSDETTLDVMKEVYNQYAYILDPHTAVGYYALHKNLKEKEVGLVLATASSKKFEKVIQKVITDFPSPKVDLTTCAKQQIPNDYNAYQEIIRQK